MIEQLNHSNCPYKGKIEFGATCPILYHTLYPYFLALLYDAKFTYNEAGDIDVCCPAANGVDTLVRKSNNDGDFDPLMVSDKMDWVIHAEVVKVGGCPHGHKTGDKILFPIIDRDHYMCPAIINNVYPFLPLDIPPCIDLNNLRCPDWVSDMLIRVKVKK